MITEEEYKKALEVVRAYDIQMLISEGESGSQTATIYDLEISKKTFNTLLVYINKVTKREDFKEEQPLFLKDIFFKINLSELSGYRYFGKGCLQELINAFASHGFKLR